MTRSQRKKTVMRRREREDARRKLPTGIRIGKVSVADAMEAVTDCLRREILRGGGISEGMLRPPTFLSTVTFPLEMRILPDLTKKAGGKAE